jgi:hypothetical protein
MGTHVVDWIICDARVRGNLPFADTRRFCLSFLDKMPPVRRPFKGDGFGMDSVGSSAQQGEIV